MATKNETLQAAYHAYENVQGHSPSGLDAACRWAVAEGLVELPTVDPHAVLAAQMGSALREEMATDDMGRRYRVNHHVRISRGGVQYNMWAQMGYAPHEHMEISFAQRREQIIGDCVQLKTDVDVYNRMNAGIRPPIQLILNFVDDVAERELQIAA